MDGVGRAVGAPAHVRWRGRLRAVRLDLGIIGEVEQFILAERPNPLSIARQLEGLIDEDVYAQVHDEAVLQAIERNAVAPDDLQEFLQSSEGLAFVLWANFRDIDSESYESILECVLALDDVARTEMIERVFQAGGIDDFGSLDWFKPVTREEAGKRVLWRLLQRESFENLGLLPHEFSRLTIYQIQTLSRSKKELQGEAAISISREEHAKLTSEERRELRESVRYRNRRYKKKG